MTAEVFKEIPSDDPENEPPSLKPIYIASVVQDPRMVFFQWPKLGAYLAIPLVYNSCLLDTALD